MSLEASNCVLIRSGIEITLDLFDQVLYGVRHRRKGSHLMRRILFRAKNGKKGVGHHFGSPPRRGNYFLLTVSDTGGAASVAGFTVSDTVGLAAEGAAARSEAILSRA